MVIYPELPPVAILLGDNMPGIIRILRKAVKDLGEIFYATSGDAALAMARTQQPDLILLDIEMPGMDGYAVCKSGVDFIHKPLKLQQLGVRTALDDFGTGYSSLAYLKRFPLNVLKIGQSFVRNMLDSEVDISIVKAIVQMAAGLKLGLVAE